MGKHKKPVYGPCAYCGQVGKLTRDHVLPQCLFHEQVPGDVPIVYACRQCNNNEKSQDDTYLRDMLARDGHAVASYAVQAIRQGTFLRSVQKGYSAAILRDVSAASFSAKFLELVTPSGLLVQQSRLPEERIKRILTRIVCGLSQAYIGHRPPMYPSMVMRVPDFARFMGTTQEMRKDGGYYKAVGDGSVFWCVYLYSPTKPELSMWCLCMYQRVGYFVAPGQGWMVTPEKVAHA